MIIYTLIFRPLECTYTALDNIYWYRAMLLAEKDKSPFIIGATGLDGSLIYFEPEEEETGKETWNMVKKYKRMDNLVGSEHDFIINKHGKKQEVESILQDLLQWG